MNVNAIVSICNCTIEMYDSVELYTKQMFIIYTDKWTQCWRETERSTSPRLVVIWKTTPALVCMLRNSGGQSRVGTWAWKRGGLKEKQVSLVSGLQVNTGIFFRSCWNNWGEHLGNLMLGMLWCIDVMRWMLCSEFHPTYYIACKLYLKQFYLFLAFFSCDWWTNILGVDCYP